MARRKILLIGWDAADWKVIHPLIEAGKMPNVKRLAKGGAVGPITTLHPPLSPMLWTSIATGKRPFKHGIHGFAEPRPDGRGVQPISQLSRKAKALWNILNQKGMQSIVVGWWPSHPAEPIDGVMVSDLYHRANRPLEQGWAMPPHAVHPPELADTVGALRTHPDQITPELTEPFIPLAREIDQDNDQRLALFLRTLAECMSIHSTALWLIEHQPWDFAAIYFDTIDHFCHGFMRYHPPRQSWVNERDFEIYQNVVSMAYQLQDQQLGELLAKAGDDVTVVLMSDHGFHPDHLRPASIPDIPAGPAVEHRDLGILVIHGPEIEAGHQLRGASVLDVAPTILTLLGLPVGEDMDGKVLLGTPQQSIGSWEDVPGNDGRHPPHTIFDPVASQAAMEQMIALGYIEKPNEDRETAIARAIRELRYNLGEAYQDAARHVEAHEIFAELHAADSADQRFALRLFASCQALGMRDEMVRVAGSIKMDVRAQILIVEKRYAEALEHVPEWSLLAGHLHLRLRRWKRAREVFENALAADPDNTHAQLGLARAALGQRNFSVAAQKSLDALQNAFHDPMAHYILGCALAGSKQHARAADAFRAAISLNPNFPQAHTRLARLLGGEGAREHRLLLRRMRRREPRAIEAKSHAKPETVPSHRMPPVEESLIVVTGLPRSGTSMVMQMLAAGGADVLSDGLRGADQNNPHGYFEFEPVKALLKDSKWLFAARGKAVKIVAPLLTALPKDLPCRAILCIRDLDEVLNSQARMLGRPIEPREILKAEYARAIHHAKAILSKRHETQLLVIEHREAISQPITTAKKISEFLDSTLDAEKMATAIDPTLHRNRAKG